VVSLPVHDGPFDDVEPLGNRNLGKAQIQAPLLKVVAEGVQVLWVWVLSGFNAGELLMAKWERRVDS